MRIVESSITKGIVFKGLYSETLNKDTIIIHIHGMAGDFYRNNYYQLMHEKYPKNGIAFLAGENRGTHTINQLISTNGVENFGNAYEIFEDCIEDIDAWIKYARDLGYSDIWLQAHSLGPSKIAYYMYKNSPEFIKGLIFISPSDMIGLVHDKVGIRDHNKMLPEAKDLLERGLPDQLLSTLLWGDMKISAKTYINFFDEGAKTGVFNYATPEMGWDVVNSIAVPVLAITGTEDDGIAPVIDPRIAMDILKSELENSPKVDTKVYDGCNHAFDGFEENIVNDVIEFVTNQ